MRTRDSTNNRMIRETPLPHSDSAQPGAAEGACVDKPGTTRFAVVITSYNYRNFVIEAVESALAQKRRAEQVIVVDDGSTDGSDILLREHYAQDERVTLICTGNGGQLAAFQKGIAAVSADVICFLDSDDRWAPEYLAKLGEIYDARSDMDFVFTDMRHFDQEDRLVAFHSREVDLGYTAISTYMLTLWYGVPTSAISMRAAWARRVTDLPDSFLETWRTSPDNCLVYGTSVLGARKYYLPTGCVDYRIHGKNAWLSNRSPKQAYRNLLHSRVLIEHYARLVGIDDSFASIELCKLEYKTKPNPPWFETRHYFRLVMMRRVWPPWRKWERALSILARGWRMRR